MNFDNRKRIKAIFNAMVEKEFPVRFVDNTISAVTNMTNSSQRNLPATAIYPLVLTLSSNKKLSRPPVELLIILDAFQHIPGNPKYDIAAITKLLKGMLPEYEKQIHESEIGKYIQSSGASIDVVEVFTTNKVETATIIKPMAIFYKMVFKPTTTPDQIVETFTWFANFKHVTLPEITEQ